MNETTSEAANLDFEGLAQAARLVAPVSSGAAGRSRRAPPPPPPSLPDANAWDAAALQFEADWATPVGDDDLPSEPPNEAEGDVSSRAEEPMAEAEEVDSVTVTSELSDAEATALAKASVPDGELESELDALAKSVAKSARETLAARKPALGRSLPAPPLGSRVPPPPPAPPSVVASRPPLKPPPPRPSRTPLPPLMPPPSSQRPSPLPVAPSLTAPRLPAPAPLPRLATPTLVEIRHSPLARRYYAQLGVAAVFGALLTIVLFALTPKASAPTATSAAPPPAAETPATNPPQAAEADPIPPPPPVANLSVDELAREPAKVMNPVKETKAPAPINGAPPAAAEPAPAPSVAATEPPTKGLLQINAVPPANVAIDGRPLGMTPKTVRLSPGVHRVALIGPQGRRSQTVNVTAGRTTGVSVKF